MKYRVLDRESLYRGFLAVDRLRLRHELYAGGESDTVTRELVERGHAVVALPYDAVADVVVMIEQFRVGAMHLDEGPWLLELVAGMVEPGESEEDVARREALEEAGITLTDLEPVARYLPSAGACSESVTILCGRCDAGNAGGVHGLDSEHEDILVRPLPADEAIALVDRRELRSAAPIIALEWLRRERPRLRREWGRGS